MEISKKEFLREALETGFRPEIMEKVWHLMAREICRIGY